MQYEDIDTAIKEILSVNAETFNITDPDSNIVLTNLGVDTLNAPFFCIYVAAGNFLSPAQVSSRGQATVWIFAGVAPEQSTNEGKKTATRMCLNAKALLQKKQGDVYLAPDFSFGTPVEMVQENAELCVARLAFVTLYEH